MSAVAATAESVPTRITEDIIAAGAFVSTKGWTPATAGNLSARVSDRAMAITASGVDKGVLRSADVLLYDLAANRVRGARAASAETALHVERYAADPGVGAVVHVHARNATVLSMVSGNTHEIRLEGYGIRTHETGIGVPLFANTQDMDALARDVRVRLSDNVPRFGYLLAGHGLYAWGRTMADALRHTEALEFLLGCELERRKVSR
jgi:methylthioribulose-1-phosphate dehydratase